MKKSVLYCAGNTAAIRYARQKLRDVGITLADSAAADVTHLLLPVPSFEASGHIKGGGSLEHLLGDLPDDITVIGGNLNHYALEGYRLVDLLADPIYTAENAAITADCAIRIAGNNLETVFNGCPILIIGWGRIGKCLAKQLGAMGADVTVSARKAHDIAMIEALGYRSAHTADLTAGLPYYRVIFNTVPAPVLSEAQIPLCHIKCVKIDLASRPGIAGHDVIWARGLPNQDAPEASGHLIAQTVIRYFREESI